MKRWTLLTAILIATFSLATNSFGQGHFVPAYSGNGQDQMNINVVEAMIGGVALGAGDEIAVFDGTICCGKAVLLKPIVFSNPSTYISIAASKAEVGMTNGYKVGNPISFKYWDSSKRKEMSGIASNFINTNGVTITAPTFTIGASAFVKLSVAALPNQSPVSNAGIDQSVNEGSVVTLNGSGSSDPDYDALKYTWTAPAGITLSSTTTAKPTFTAPQVSVNTNYTFTLIVNDGTVNSLANQVIVTVNHINNNQAPVANANVDQSVLKNTVYTLDGSWSKDPDGTALSYLWTAPVGITLSSRTTVKPTFTSPNVTVNTNYTFSLVVSDGVLSSAANQVVITVKPTNKSPVSNAGPNQSVNEGTLVTLNGTASSDPDLDVLKYRWTAPAGIKLYYSSLSKPTFTAPPVSVNTNYTFSLIVNDGTVNSVADQVIVTVNNTALKAAFSDTIISQSGNPGIFVDHAPFVMAAINDISVEKPLSDILLDLNTIFADKDQDDVLNFSVTSNSNNSVVQTDVSGNKLTLSFSSENTGLSTIVITASSNGKETTSEFNVEVKSPTGIGQENGVEDVQIYPNPTNGEVHLKFNNLPESNTWITVFNSAGSKISKVQAVGQTQTLNLNGNPPGIYFIKTDQNSSKTYKVVLQ